MGEAKRKRAATVGVEHLAQVDLARVATALRKLFAATSAERGVDCSVYAQCGQYLLQRLGVAAEVALGYAAWRVGDAAAATVVHHPAACSVAGVTSFPPLTDQAASYHAWIELGGRIFDCTTHDLARKSAILDAHDGRRTKVDWCPDFVLVQKGEVSSAKQVIEARHGGVFYYERVPGVEAWYRAAAEAKPVDDYTAGMLWLIY